MSGESSPVVSGAAPGWFGKLPGMGDFAHRRLPEEFRDQLGRLTTPVDQYAATRVPTLFLTSDEDGLIWPELSSMAHEHVPGSRFVRVEAAGHSTYFERPDVFNREVGGFLKAHRP